MTRIVDGKVKKYIYCRQ